MVFMVSSSSIGAELLRMRMIYPILTAIRLNLADSHRS